MSPVPISADRVTSGESLPRNSDILTDEEKPWQPETQDDYAVLAIRSLVCDMCMQNGGGHAGSALGMAAIGVALWKHVMRYDPGDPDWINRDRFVLSNGHASMFLYVMNYLVGYTEWTVDQLRGYGDPKLNGYKTMAHGHPEIQEPGIELTTGPLGQGIANSVGLAIAAKNLGGTYNIAEHKIIDPRIYCMTGDGCLMEGVALEAISLAGHMQLDNLTLIYDNNNVTCDGPLSWINNEDVNQKMRACGWEVVDVFDGRYNVPTIVQALKSSSTSAKPVFINIRTIIGQDTAAAGTFKAHHGAIDCKSVRDIKQKLGVDPDSIYKIPEKTLSYFRAKIDEGKQEHDFWTASLKEYARQHSDLHKNLMTRLSGFRGDFEQVLGSMDATQFEGLATRESNGIVLQKLWEAMPGMIGGGADLITSNKFAYSTADVFDAVRSPSGRYIRHGIREHAMVAAANGIAALAPNLFMPITSTFAIFFSYAVPAIRMGALSDLQVIHSATHDSFAEGQNGPTHQPVELDSLLRAMPNLLYFRPCDGEEVIGAWAAALRAKKTPSIISVARDPTGAVPNTYRDKVSRGAYTVLDHTDAAVTLVSCGSNLQYAVAAAKSLSDHHDIKCRVVSAPCLSIFDQQSQEYQRETIPWDHTAVISIEEYVPTVWARYVTASIGMTGFGYSASNESNYARFGLDAKSIERKVVAYVHELDGRNARSLPWKLLT